MDQVLLELPTAITAAIRLGDPPGRKGISDGPPCTSLIGIAFVPMLLVLLALARIGASPRLA